MVIETDPGKPTGGEGKAFRSIFENKAAGYAGGHADRKPVQAQRCYLEGDFATQLPESWFVRSKRRAEATVWEVQVYAVVREIRPVEEVEQFKPELEVHAFRDGRVLVEIDIRLKEVRATELHWLLVPSGPKGWDRKIALWDRSRQPSFVVR